MRNNGLTVDDFLNKFTAHAESNLSRIATKRRLGIVPNDNAFSTLVRTVTHYGGISFALLAKQSGFAKEHIIAVSKSDQKALGLMGRSERLVLIDTISAIYHRRAEERTS
jgi:hypothetical protein